MKRKPVSNPKLPAEDPAAANRINFQPSTFNFQPLTKNKNMKSLFPRLTALALIFSLAACNSNDDNAVPVPADSANTNTVSPGYDSGMNNMNNNNMNQGTMGDTTGSRRMDSGTNNNRNSNGTMNDTGRNAQKPPR